MQAIEKKYCGAYKTGEFMKVPSQNKIKPIPDYINKKLTQEQIAEAVGLSAKHYGCIERGEVSTTVAVLTRLQQVLEFEVSIMIKI